MVKLLKRGYGLRGKEFSRAMPEPTMPKNIKLAALKAMISPSPIAPPQNGEVENLPNIGENLDKLTKNNKKKF